VRETYGLKTTNARREILINSKPGDAAKFQDKTRVVPYNRRVYFTKEGLFGLGPKTMKLGDQVCVLLGGRVLFVLRLTQNGWLLVGETYLHNLNLILGKVANDVSKRAS
jgi:hypothetical protein